MFRKKHTVDNPFAVKVSYEPHELEIYSEIVRVARKVHMSDRQVVGFWPASPTVAIPPLISVIGQALSNITTLPMALIDANIRWPGVVLPQGEAAKDANESLFTRLQLSEKLTLFMPQQIGPEGAGVPQLRLLVQRIRGRFHHILVDLTGFDKIGEHLNALEIMEGIYIVGRARESMEYDYLRIHYQIPKDLNLGVILQG